MDYIINSLFTVLQVVANYKTISHIVDMILIKNDLLRKYIILNKTQEVFVTRLK